MARKKKDKDAEIKITKVGKKNDNVFVHFETDHGGEVASTILEADTPPNPEYEKALGDLGKHIAGMMGFPKEWNFRAISASFNYEEDGRKGVTVHLLVTLPKFDKPISINSPHMREKVVGAGGGGTFMSAKILELCEEVIAEGRKYMYGDRAQKELLPETEEEEGSGEE